ncbi:MAG: DNA gyrase inhibitor YacG [Planctomycetota bacterium]|jgi:endogenous inhibitor of DNA gyrase (YacG/DUF329 family)
MSERSSRPPREREERVAGKRCPVCGHTVDPGQDSYPFCSARCRLVDLGQWFGERYRVSRTLEQKDIEEG